MEAKNIIDLSFDSAPISKKEFETFVKEYKKWTSSLEGVNPTPQASPLTVYTTFRLIVAEKRIKKLEARLKKAGV